MSHLTDRPPAYQPVPVEQPRNGFAVKSLVTGLIGVALGWVPFANLVLGVIAIVFGALGLRQANQGQSTAKGMSIAGLVLGIIAVITGVVLLIAIGLHIPGTPVVFRVG
ncbi:MAG TPA: DUF4190 domain-containing protein [Streptosporangiaceae bacterium]|nr:DUF4190 domain-containing protein [Streptosporangiaceae bacterium]